MYELCTISKSLFEAPDLLHEARKSTLAETIWTATGKKDAKRDKDVSYICLIEVYPFQTFFSLTAIMFFLTMAKQWWFLSDMRKSLPKT